MKSIVTKPVVASAGVFLVSFIVYLLTMAPGVPFIDGGELAAACSTLGICHPTGYPLFTLVGYVFAHLPIASQVIVRLNIMSAFFTALGSGAMVFLGHELAINWFSLAAKKGQVHAGSTNEETAGIGAGIFLGLATAFSQTWWAQSNSIEVYPLHCFLITVALIFFFRMLRLEKETFGKNSILFALTLGLSFSNHLTTVLLAPGCLYLYFVNSGINQKSLKKIVWLAVPFIIGLLPYLYFPIRSSQYPIMDWGHPTDFTLFMKHFTGGQYKIWMFTPGASAKNFPYFWHEFPTEFSYAGLIMLLAGVFALLINTHSKKLHLLVFLLLLFFGCLFYSVNFDILEIDPYFLTAYVACLIVMCLGAIWAATAISGMAKSTLITSLIGLAIIFAAFEISTNYSTVDESGNHFVDDCTMNVLKNLPKNAILFSSAWDFWLSGAFYYQLVENVRPDVLVVDVAMLRDRPWYYSYLKQRAPEAMARVKPELDAFMVHLNRFDRGEPFDGQAISETYRTFTEALVRKNLDRPILISKEVLAERDPLFAPSFKPVPAGLEFRLLEHDSVFDIPLPTIQWNDSKYRERNYYTDGSRTLQAGSLAARADYIARLGKDEEAKKWLDLALKFMPDMTVDLDKLQPRDREYGYSTNDQFARIQKARASYK